MLRHVEFEFFGDFLPSLEGAGFGKVFFSN